jgi:glycosyltransferase involved in cell wall biosynthesis
MRPEGLQMRRPIGTNADVWVIVPMFNEATVVRSVLTALRRFFPNVVAVDDGSADSSAAEAMAAGARLVRHAVNLGAGAAIQTGLEFALLDGAARYFVTFDADGQHRAEDAAGMVDRLRSGHPEILIGSRFLGSTLGATSGRKSLLRVARVFEWLTSGVRLTDAHNGLRAFTRNFAERIDLTFSDMAHATELLVQIKKSQLPYAEHPVTIEYTDYSRSKGQRSINSVNIAVDVWLNHLLRGRR